MFLLFLKLFQKHPEKVPDPDDMEDDPLPLPEFLDKYMVTGRLAKWIVSSKIFEAVILLSIIGHPPPRPAFRRASRFPQ